MQKMLLSRGRKYNSDLILVNAENPYREDERQLHLCPVYENTSVILLEEHAQRKLSGLMEEIGGWDEIVPVSGWRSLEEQQEIYRSSLRENGEEFTRKFVALPGCSEHQTGLAIDLGLKKEKIDFICPDFPSEGICQRFRARAAAYGFIERYQKEKEHITGISAEPWHFRYVGCPHAERMNRLGLCLEEYIALLREGEQTGAEKEDDGGNR